MPIHDWTRLEAGDFHDFHQCWVVAIRSALNGGLLPPGNMAMAEEVTGRPIPDVVTLHTGSVDDELGGVAIAAAPPSARLIARRERIKYAKRADRVVIRHGRGKVVAIIEIISPRNKDSRNALRNFVEKAADILNQGVHLLVVDLFPPSVRDPQGIHKAIWDEFEDQPFQAPPGKPLTVVSYQAGDDSTAYVESVGVGDDAEALTRRALAINKKSLGLDNPHVATDLNNLAMLLRDTNRAAEAEPLMQRALAIDEKSLGVDHPKVATDLDNLAMLLKDTNRLTEAEPLMRRALDIDEKSFGPDHPNVAVGLSNLAQLLQDANRLAEAEPLMQRALAIDEKSFGPDHPAVARDLNNLAGLLKDTNRLAEAEPLMRRALAIDEKSLGVDHPNVATDLINLAMLLQASNRPADAEPLLRRAVEIRIKSLVVGHPGTRSSRTDLAILELRLNKPAGAEPVFRDLVAGDRAAFPERDVRTANSLSGLGRSLLMQGKFAEAESPLREALSIREEKLGIDDAATKLTAKALRELLEKTGRQEEAERVNAKYRPDIPASTQPATQPAAPAATAPATGPATTQPSGE